MDGNRKIEKGEAKPPLSMIPLSAMGGVAGAFKHGADKYGVRNWREGETAERIYTDAALRHITAHNEGEVIDPDTGELEIAHLDLAICNLIILRDLQRLGKNIVE